MQIAHVTDLARRSAALGCDLVRVFTSYEHGGGSFLSAWRTTVEALQACCDRAAALGVRIGVQNHHDIGVDTAAYLELLAEVDRPNIVPMFDCWSPFLRGEDVVAAAAALAPRMSFTTVADYRLLRRWKYLPTVVNYAPSEPPGVLAVPMGQGDLPYEDFLKALQANGFDGWVNYEMCSPLRGGGSMTNLEACARTFLDYMRPFVPAAST
jgi:sugar phosphate isomerase/epimerase